MEITSAFVLLLSSAMGLHGTFAENYVAEVLFVVEPGLVRQYQGYGYNADNAMKEIEGDLNYFLFEINKKYKAMPNLNLEIRAKDILFSNGEIFDSQDMSNAYDKFWSWLDTNKAYATYGYDITLALTGYEMGGSVFKAYIRTTCSGHYAVGIVSFNGLFGTATNINWALDTLLGNSGCDSDKWTYSSCSERAMIKFINELDKNNNNCLVRTTTSPSTFTLNNVKNREIMNVHKLCKRQLKNKKATFCTYPYPNGVGKGDKLCQTLWCQPPGKHHCVSAIPSEEMPCGDRKRCNKGKCIATPAF